MNNADIIKSLNTRYATKIFDTQKTISNEDWLVIEESLRLSPSSLGLQPWKFIVIKNTNLKKNLATYSNKQVETCSHLVVICARNTIDADFIQKNTNLTANIRNLDINTLKERENNIINNLTNREQQKNFEWTTKQAYITLGFSILTASLLGIDSCPMEGFSTLEFTKVLNLESSQYTPVVIAPFGYRSSDDKYAKLSKVRFAKEDVITTIQ